MGIAAPAAMLPMDLGREVISRREPKIRFLSSAPGSWWHNERPERGQLLPNGDPVMTGRNAPIPDGRRSGVPLGSSTDSGPSRPAPPTEPRIRYPRASLRQVPTRPACSFARRMVAVSAPIAPRLCLRERPPAVPRDRARPGRHRRARTGPSPGRTGRSFSRDIR